MVLSPPCSVAESSLDDRARGGMRAISTEGNAHLEVGYMGENQAHFSLDFNLGHSFGHS